MEKLREIQLKEPCFLQQQSSQIDISHAQHQEQAPIIQQLCSQIDTLQRQLQEQASVIQQQSAQIDVLQGQGQEQSLKIDLLQRQIQSVWGSPGRESVHHARGTDTDQASAPEYCSIGLDSAHFEMRSSGAELRTTTLVMRIAGTEYEAQHMFWRAWAILYGILLVSRLLYRTGRWIVLGQSDIGFAALLNGDVGFALVQITPLFAQVQNFAHWFWSIRLRRHVQRVHVDIWKQSGIYFLVVLALLIVWDILVLRVAPDCPGGVFAFFVRVLSDMQNMLSSWATAILLQQEVLVLRSEFQCALAAESSLSGFDKIFRATRSRWICYLSVYLLSACLYSVLYIAKFSKHWTEGEREMVELVFAFNGIQTLMSLMVHFLPILAYNKHVDDAATSAQSFAMLQDLRKRRLHFRVFNIVLKPKMFIGFLVSAILGVASEAYLILRNYA